MIFIYGNNKATELLSKHRSQIILQSDQAAIISNKNYMMLNLNKDRKIYIWGTIYSYVKDNKENVLSNNTASAVLSKAFHHIKSIKEIISNIEGRYYGIYQENKEDFIIFGDSFTSIDIFYSRFKDGIIVSSDLDYLNTFKNSIKYDQLALVNMFTVYGNYTPKKHTIYKNVSRLGVNEILLIKNGKCSITKIKFAPQNIINYVENDLQRYYEILVKAVTKRASSKCNWVYLSSGWDSTALLAILIQEYGRSRVKAVLGKMKYSKRSKLINHFEVERAKKIAKYFNIELKLVDFDAVNQQSIGYLEKIIPDLKRNHVYAYNAFNFKVLGDFINSNSAGNDVVFSGEISDGAHNFGFSQYATILEHPDLGFREYSDKMMNYLYSPSFLKRVLNQDYKKDIIYNLLRKRLLNAKFTETDKMSKKELIIEYLNSFFISPARIPFYSLDNLPLLLKKAKTEYREYILKEYLSDAVDGINERNLYSWILHLYNSFHWQGSTVKSLTTGLNEASKILNLPFWDSGMISFLSQMPEKWGRGLELRPTKYPLKWALKNRIDYPYHLQTGPHSYTYDIDPSFSHDVEWFLHSGLKEKYKKDVKDRKYREILSPKYFDLKYLDSIVDDYLEDKEISGQRFTDLTSLISLCSIGWY